MSRRNRRIFAFLCVYGPGGAAHTTPDAGAVAYRNFGSFRRSNLAGHGTTVAGVVAAPPLHAGLAAITGRSPIPPRKKFDSPVCFGIPQVSAANNGAAANPQVSVLSLEFAGTTPSPDQPSVSCDKPDFEIYYRLSVGHNTQFAGHPSHIAGTVPGVAFNAPIRDRL